ncbi:MAG: alanine racemase [Oscillospiraceae bacterium]
MKDFLRRTWAEIHLDRMEHNVKELMKLTSDSTAPAAVVKANAYGHDDIHCVPFLEKCGISFFAVSNINEAEKLRSCGCKGDILILGYTPPEYADTLERYDIIQAAVCYEHAKALSDRSHGAVRVHMAIDTGMGRIGLLTDDLKECADEFEKAAALPHIKLEGAFTHFASADSFEASDMEYTSNQIERFFALRKELDRRGVQLKHYHCLNSAGSVFHFDSRSTLARFGILMYGLKPDYSLDIPFELKPVMDFKSSVSYVKTLKKGSYVSYGRTYRADRDIPIATIPAGYADGFSRNLSGKASVIINGRKAPIIGRICMDQFMADISGIPDVTAGTEVTLFGGECGQTADDLAQLYGTIGYEIVCGISKRVPRVIMYNGEIVDVSEY